MTLLDRQKEVAKYLEAGFKEYELPGISLKGAASFVGNFTQENLVNPVTTGKKDHGSDAMGQWRLDRLDGPRGLRGWCAAHGLDWATLRSQSAFTLWELYNDARYNNLAADLKAGKKKIATLTANICVQYERPSDEEYVKKYRNPQTGELESLLDRRIVAAQATYDAVMKERVSPTAKATGVGAGGTLIAIGANNAAAGGSDALTATTIIAGALSVVGPWLWGAYKKARTAPEVTPAGNDVVVLEPTEITPPNAFAPLEARVANIRAIKAQLDAEVKGFMEALQQAKEKAEVDRIKLVAAEAGVSQLTMLAAPAPVPGSTPAPAPKSPPPQVATPAPGA